MRRGFQTWARAKTAAVLLCAASAITATEACSDSPPPLAELSMRDALGAEPAVVLSLPQESREALADKFKGTLETQTVTEEAEGLGAITPAEEVRSIDDARAAQDKDSLLAADVKVAQGRLVAHARAFTELSQSDAGPAPSASAANAPLATQLPPIEGDVPTETKEEETRALSGAAGRVIARMLADTHAHRVMRVTRWPMAAVAIDDVVYVNAAWLVAMAAREPVTNAAANAGGAGGVAFVAPQSLRGNPYHLYDTLNQCIGDVQGRCQTCLAGGTCDDHATLSDYPDGKSECTYLLGGGQRPVYPGGPQIYGRVQELCAMALLDVCTVASCVTKESCTLPVGLSVDTSVNISSSMLVSADVFVTDDRCVKVLDLCLSGTPFGLDAGFDLSFNVKIEGCQDPFKACGSSCSAVGSACSNGRCSGGSNGPSCTSCSGCTTCSGCGSDTRTSGGGNSGYGSGGYQAGGNKSRSSGGCGSCGSSSAGLDLGFFDDAGSGPSDAGTPRSARRVDPDHSDDFLANNDAGAGALGGARQVDPSHGVDTKSHRGSLTDPSAPGTPDEDLNEHGTGGSACAVRPQAPDARTQGDPPFAPATTLFWLLLPIGYLAARTRRTPGSTASGGEGGAS